MSARLSLCQPCVKRATCWTYGNLLLLSNVNCGKKKKRAEPETAEIVWIPPRHLHGVPCPLFFIICSHYCLHNSKWSDAKFRWIYYISPRKKAANVTAAGMSATPAALLLSESNFYSPIYVSAISFIQTVKPLLIKYSRNAVFLECIIFTDVARKSTAVEGKITPTHLRNTHWHTSFLFPFFTSGSLTINCKL